MSDRAAGTAAVPTEECDLVMKGGITSGIVYPPLILKLKDRYRFRAIGGTSAGAIAAAGAAAAELGRETGGFDELRKMQEVLSQGTFLRDLFQPAPRLAPLMQLALRAMDRRAKGSKGAGFVLWFLWSALRQPWPQWEGKAGTVGLFTGVLLALLFTGLPVASLALAGAEFNPLAALPAFVLLGFVLGRIGAVVGALFELVTRDLPNNQFGMCTGRADGGAAGHGHGPAHAHGASAPPAAVLTDWLHERFTAMAGPALAGRVLTFGDLAKKHVTLRMFTSDLSQYQPYVLPFENHLFVFQEAEFRRFFPADVVEHMKSVASKHPRAKDFKLPAGYFLFPDADDLPVIVATRMSLSFPILLSAIPLYTIAPSKAAYGAPGAVLPVEEGELQRNWFSDGGICSNFPIQFFDGWLPGRPTFGVNLTSMPPEAMDGKGAPLHDSQMSYVGDPTRQEGERTAPVLDPIYLPKPDATPATEWVNLDGNLARFLFSIFTTAQVYRDNDQAMLPSYRERIVQIRLRDDEGGLNLAMSPETIQGVIRKGDRAGETLLNDFNFKVHSWVRFRVLSTQLEAGLMQMRRQLNGPHFQGFPGNLAGTKDLPFEPENFTAWCEQAEERLGQLNAVLGQWENRDPKLFGAEKLPVPEAVLRVGPKV
ncbi:patatin-like phospholipase family protein [Azohydromonas aeria]|uniref:patatin-like phospholipase family protein n=1 Tax=Azohydromonas aeria TaxID=2590212 RepID=UPI0012F7E897|nr:patatin-like phospholipase family protein [Azohydromonas aeria]